MGDEGVFTNFEHVFIDENVISDLEKIFSGIGLIQNADGFERKGVRVSCRLVDGYTEVCVDAANRGVAHPAIEALNDYIDSESFKGKEAIVNTPSGEFRGCSG
jgi:hypothetical protein